MDAMKDYFIEEATTFTPEIPEALMRLTKQLNSNYQPLSDEDITAIVDAPHTRLFFARLTTDRKIVGMVTLVTFRSPYKMKGSIEDVVVDSEYRKKGIGQELMNYVVDVARTAGVKSLSFTSKPTRVDANRLYERLGFEKRDTNVYRITL
jgi:ribosomal protein S18 acetylase RimI-like enzyme